MPAVEARRYHQRRVDTATGAKGTVQGSGGRMAPGDERAVKALKQLAGSRPFVFLSAAWGGGYALLLFAFGVSGELAGWGIPVIILAVAAAAAGAVALIGSALVHFSVGGHWDPLHPDSTERRLEFGTPGRPLLLRRGFDLCTAGTTGVFLASVAGVVGLGLHGVGVWGVVACLPPLWFPALFLVDAVVTARQHRADIARLPAPLPPSQDFPAPGTPAARGLSFARYCAVAINGALAWAAMWGLLVLLAATEDQDTALVPTTTLAAVAAGLLYWGAKGMKPGLTDEPGLLLPSLHRSAAGAGVGTLTCMGCGILYLVARLAPSVAPDWLKEMFLAPAVLLTIPFPVCLALIGLTLVLYRRELRDRAESVKAPAD